MKLSGDFISSIRAKNKIVGNIKDINLQDLLLEERLKPYWSLSKDKIGVCKDCEYLYVCDDCRISASTLEGKNPHHFLVMIPIMVFGLQNQIY